MGQRLKIRVDDVTGPHVRFTVFANGANCGQIVMRTEEWQVFSVMLKAGCNEVLQSVGAQLEFDEEKFTGGKGEEYK